MFYLVNRYTLPIHKKASVDSPKWKLMSFPGCAAEFLIQRDSGQLENEDAITV